MLAHRLQRWSNIGQALGQCLVFAGKVVTPPPQSRNSHTIIDPVLN